MILDNGLKDLWIRENPDCFEFNYYDRPSGTKSITGRVYTDIKLANNTKINHTVVSFAKHHNAIYLDRLPSKAKIGKNSW